MLLTGDPGVGKTRVVRCFLQQLPRPCVVAVVGSAHRHALALLQTVCGLFGLALPGAPAGARSCMDALNAFLLSTHAQGRQAMLIVDDAHQLSPELLELLRLLTNLETPERKLLQIVLVGRSELRDRLAEPTMEQLAQRVTARLQMTGLSAQEMSDYVVRRTQAAGRQAPQRMNRAVLKRSGFVAWLNGEPATIWNRLQADPMTADRRPNLTATGGLAEVVSIMQARQPLYAETASVMFPTEGHSPETVAVAILNAWQAASRDLPPANALG